MKSLALQQEQKSIDHLITQISRFTDDPSTNDPLISAQLTYLLCIRISGFIENCVRIIFNEYCAPRSKDFVANYVSVTLQKFPNPTYESICKLVKAFDGGWLANFKSSVSEQNRIALYSINVNRNAIAHGNPSGITLHQLTLYYAEVLDLLEKLEKTCNY